MNFELCVDEGAARGQTWELTQDVVRVGSGPHMTVQLTGVPEWGFTLFERGGEVFVLNRSCVQLRVGDQMAAPGTRTRWQPEEPLRCDGPTQLRLQQAGRQQVITAATNLDALPAEAIPEPESPFEKRARQAVILLTTWALIFVYATAFSSAADQHERLQHTFDNLITRLRSDRTPQTYRYRKVERILRQAWLAELWQSLPEAARRYEQLRSELARPVAPPSKLPQDRWEKDLDARVLSFVTHRIGQLQLD